jgi:hypothetical protein
MTYEKYEMLTWAQKLPKSSTLRFTTRTPGPVREDYSPTNVDRFLPLVSPLASDIMTRLLNPDRFKRLGYKGGREVKLHKWCAAPAPSLHLESW